MVYEAKATSIVTRIKVKDVPMEERDLDQKRFYLPMLNKVFSKILQTSSYRDMDSHFFELSRTL